MPRPRAFDHDEARRLRAEGLSYREIGRRLGVSSQSVGCACDPRRKAKSNASRDRSIKAKMHPCFGGCGKLVYDHYITHKASGYCHACLGERRNVIRHGTETEYHQGCRCRDCTTAASTARRIRRQRTANELRAAA